MEDNSKYPSKWHERFYRSDRIEFFSDAVFAIVLTLLVLDLHPPVLKRPESATELWTATKAMLPHFRSFFITFIWIANMWMGNHQFMKLLVKTDMTVLWLTLYMLMIACLLPFPTSLMGEYPMNPLGV